MPSSSSSSESVTVTVLPDVLALVHIPRSRLKYFSHQVVKQILTPGPSFLNITCNKIELSLFADQSVLAEFEPLARKDRQRIRRSASLRRTRARSHSIRKNDPIEVSYDTWNVLQIDSHDDRLDKAGARVRELSAPLAAAGLSILYQSSYMSDYIFVKSSRLAQVLSRLAHAGFVGYSFDLTSQMSPIFPNTSCGDDEEAQPFSLDSQSDVWSSDNASLKAIRRSTDTARPLVLQRDEAPAPAPAHHTSSISESQSVTPTPPASAFERRGSLSPCPSDVQILDVDLACVGLADSCSEIWASKIIKLVAYPELISPSSASRVPLPAYVADSFESADAIPALDGSMFEEGIKVPRKIPRAMPPTPDAWSSSASTSDSASSIETSPSSSGEDGYFSSASFCSASGSTPSLLSSRSYPELSDASSALSSKARLRLRPRLPRLTTVTGMTKGLAGSPVSTARAEDSHEQAVPFFSFTRTAEGSSLTTGLGLIAALFPPSERHMIICSDELRLGVGEDEDMAVTPPVGSTMRCLQIDLQRFGLDKHGLISRFSKVLDSSGINHMYSSTYKTANLLVDKADAVRSQALLRCC